MMSELKNHKPGTVTHLEMTRGRPARAVRPIFLKLLLAAVLVAAVFSVTGCTALHRPEELAWQGMHVYDSLATMDIVDDPCYAEGHAVTSRLIGSNPSREAVAGWAIGGALFHVGVSDFLLTHDHPKLYKAWQVVTIADTGAAIGQGISIGVRVGAPNTRVIENGCR